MFRTKNVDLYLKKNNFINTNVKLSSYQNDNYIVQKEDGSRFVLRKRKKNKETDSIRLSIREWYRNQGFFDRDNSYRFRSPLEQVTFIKKLQNLDIPTILPIIYDSQYILFPYVNGMSLHKYIAKENVDFEKAVDKALQNIFLAHRNNIVFGDRWGTNTIIINNNALEIDFDVEMIGPTVREFELAKVLYHFIHFSSKREDMTKYLTKHIDNNWKQFLDIRYDKHAIIFSLERHIKTFASENFYEYLKPLQTSELPSIVNGFSKVLNT